MLHFFLPMGREAFETVLSPPASGLSSRRRYRSSGTATFVTRASATGSMDSLLPCSFPFTSLSSTRRFGSCSASAWQKQRRRNEGTHREQESVGRAEGSAALRHRIQRGLLPKPCGALLEALCGHDGADGDLLGHHRQPPPGQRSPP